MINRHSSVPPYRQLADVFRAMILTGELAPGTRLPPYSAIAHTYGCGIGTVTRAMAQLRDAGLIESGTGGPTYVRERMKRKTAKLTSGSRLISRMPTSAEQEAHGIEPGVPVVVVTSADGQVVVYPSDRWDFTSA